MNCFICDKKLIVGKKMVQVDTGMYDVEIITHCVKCRKLKAKFDLLQNENDCISIEMKGHLREYRCLAKRRKTIRENLLNVEYEIYKLSHVSV